MKYIFIFFLLTSSLFSQEYNKLDSNGKKHGIWKGIYEQSQRPRYEGNFNEGKEVGMFKFFDDTKAGTVIATREFNLKNNSCYTIFYNQKNNKVSEGNVVNKKFEGEWKYYHENSPSLMTIEFYSDGKLEGVRKVFFASGKIAEETTYSSGIKNGSSKKYTETGIVIEESTFVNGQYDGLALFKSSDGQIVAKGMFKTGKKVDVWKILENEKLKDVNMNKQGKKFQKRVKKLDY